MNDLNNKQKLYLIAVFDENINDVNLIINLKQEDIANNDLNLNDIIVDKTNNTLHNYLSQHIY